MNAAPDGYTLLMASTGALMAVSAGAESNGPFDVNKVLTPIVIGAAPPYLLVASPSLPVKTTADLIRYAKEKPDGLTFGSSGVGAASHLSGLLFASQTGIKMLHVPYKGTGPAVTDLIGGRIDVMFAPGPVVQQFVQSGQLKALGVTDTQRSKFYPDVPTVADAVPGYKSVGWFGLLAPPKTPPEIVKKINNRKRSLLVLFTGFTVGTFLCAVAPNYIVLLIGRAVAGGFAGVMGANILTIVSDVFPESRRGTAMGVVMSSFSVANIVGIYLGLEIAAAHRLAWSLLRFGALCVPVLLLAWFVLPPLRNHLMRRVVHGSACGK